MGAIYKKVFTLPLPKGAELFIREGVQYARWRPEGERPRVAPVTAGKDGSQRIRVRSSTFTAKFRDGSGRVVEKPTHCRDEGAARAVLAELERRAERVRAGVLNQQEATVSDRGAVPLDTNAKEYLRFLEIKGASQAHREDMEFYLKRIREECRFARMTDLAREPLERWLFQLLESGKSARLVNAYRSAALAFGNWAMATSRLVSNPFKGLPRADQKSDRRKVRRALTAAEMARLLEAARKRPLQDALKMNRGRFKGETGSKLRPETIAKLEHLGLERSLIYKTLLLTGLRRGELASLAVGNLSLDLPNPHAVLEAAHEKNRQGSSIPLRADLAEDLRRWLAAKLEFRQDQARRRGEPIPLRLSADTPLFDVPEGLVKIFDKDLEVAGIPKRDERGRTLDIHALRTTFATHLSRGGVPLRTAQAALRHSDPKLTANVYTDPQLLDVAGALDALPRLSIGGEEAAALEATGTTDAPEIPASSLAPALAPTRGFSCQKQSLPGNSAAIEGVAAGDGESLRNVASSQEKDAAVNAWQEQNESGPTRTRTSNPVVMSHLL